MHSSMEAVKESLILFLLFFSLFPQFCLAIQSGSEAVEVTLLAQPFCTTLFFKRRVKISRIGEVLTNMTTNSAKEKKKDQSWLLMIHMRLNGLLVFSYVFTIVAGGRCQISHGISRGARKLTRTPWLSRERSCVFTIFICSLSF